jgi:hypothetical protein
MMKRSFLGPMLYGLAPVLLFMLTPTASLADNITIAIVTSTVTVTTVSQSGKPSNIIATDVHGIGVVNVFDPVPTLLGPVEFGNLTAPFGNAVVFDADFPGLTEAVASTLDFAAADFSGSLTQILGTGSVAVGPITDPALAPFLGKLDFEFTLASSTVNSDHQTVALWDLTSITTVPEPSSLALLGTALLLVFLARRSKGSPLNQT